MAQRAPVYADDLAETNPWPRFSPAAVEAGVRSIFALYLSGDDTLGALNCYSGYPRAFGATDRARAVVLATLGGLALSHAEERRADDTRIANLEAALVTRTVIGQAQGILMERERIGADQAFDILRRASQRLNLKLRDVAQDLVDTDEGRATGPQEPPN
jgi:ANTAR domain